MKNYDESEDPDRSDTEITLGMRSVLGIFFGLVLICGVFFGFGYSLGRGNSNKAAASAQTALQSSGTASPSVVKTVVEEPVSSNADKSGSDPYSNGTPGAQPAGTPPHSKPSAASSTIPPTSNVASSSSVDANGVQAAPASYNLPAPVKAAPANFPAQPSANPPAAIMVQIAAVSRPQDADVLVSALRKLGYSASVHNETSDHLLHVQIGPFPTRSQAIAMRSKLLNDGYNAILK
jgi:DedD protein